MMGHYEYGGKVFEVPQLSSDGAVTFRPSPRAEPLRDIDKPLLEDLERFEVPRRPFVVGTIVDQQRFSQPSAVRILDMPIKFPGSEYRLPREALQFEEFIRTVAAFMHAFDPLADEKFCYLTVDQSLVPVGATQRHPGCHVDGFQGSRVSPKVSIGHSFLVADALPTVFYLQPFRTAHLSPARHNYFLEFDRQARAASEWRPAPYEISLIDPYVVHASPINLSPAPLPRTFARLSYTPRVFDRLGNAHNPLFDYQWEMVARETQAGLI